MRIDRLTSLMIASLILLAIFIVSPVQADDEIENMIFADFSIEFVNATYLDITITLDAKKLTTDQTYDAVGIQSASEQELGAFRLLLYQMLERQFDGTFENANFLDFSMPTFGGGVFTETFGIDLTPEYFGFNTSVNVRNLLNGALDMGAYVNYTLNFQAEPGWNNTYTIFFGDNINYKQATGTPYGDGIRWTLHNWDGLTPSKVAEMQIKMVRPTTVTLESENIFLDFILDSNNADVISFTTNVMVKSADIRSYNALPSFIQNLDFVPADGLRLLIDNGLITWIDTFDITISPIHEKIVSTLQASSFNQTLDIEFMWDNRTTTDIQNPYEINNMDDNPSVNAILTDLDVELKICGISSKALFGLINTGAESNISRTDVNFGDNLNAIGYDYNVTLNLPEYVYLEGKNSYTWNESMPISGIFTSDIPPHYTDEEKSTIIEIDIKSTDLNLLSFFTGKTELNFGMDLIETRNYNVTTLPSQFVLPEKVSIDYLNSDALRVCVQEGVFDEESITNFLNAEKNLFEQTIKQIISDLDISANANKQIFDDSIANWDGNISKMDDETPVKTSSYAHNSYPVSFDLSFVPPGFSIPVRTYNFTGLPNQEVTYRIIFPHGILIEASDLMNKSHVKETEDGKKYIEVTFDASESDLTVEVSCKMVPSMLFIIGVFMPCIISLVIAIVLIIIIYILRKKRKARGVLAPAHEEEYSGYEGEDYYIPPPPNSK